MAVFGKLTWNYFTVVRSHLAEIQTREEGLNETNRTGQPLHVPDGFVLSTFSKAVQPPRGDLG
ncbi:hypothetical protein IPJ72_03685 [Candidatus Peregrinibacteria bacterium]|nr:MAG: hypothetical protein IPJ72_03685 [Candidatus Peregrinibacteria bacterium]